MIFNIDINIGIIIPFNKPRYRVQIMFIKKKVKICLNKIKNKIIFSLNAIRNREYGYHVQPIFFFLKFEHFGNKTNTFDDMFETTSCTSTTQIVIHIMYLSHTKQSLN